MSITYTNFCCRSGGSNLNSGTLTGDTTEPGTTATLTYLSGTYTASTHTLTVASGNPVADGVAVGQFAALDTGTGAAVYIARITAFTSTTITLNSSGMGANPANGTLNLRIGGAFSGPSGASPFPFNLATGGNATDASNHPVKINLKNDQTYNLTAGITVVLSGPTYIAGYTTTYNDFGRAIIDGGTTGASYVLLTLSSTSPHATISDIEFRNNGATGSSVGVNYAGSNGGNFFRCVFHDVRSAGVSGGISGSTALLVQCEAYNCDQSNGGQAAFAGNFQAIRCVAHNNTSAGFGTTSFNAAHCVAHSNGANGFQGNANFLTMRNCDAYNNTGDGLHGGGSLFALVENCNFLKNTGFGINANGGLCFTRNCGYGSGTQANGSGATSGQIEPANDVTYASGASPWNAPDTGDFSIVLAAAQGAGIGSYTETASGYTGTVGHPDIGAAQSNAAGSGGSARRTGIFTGGRY